MPRWTPQQKAEIDARRARTAELYLKGWTQQQIADEVGTSQVNVSRDLAEIRAAWRAEAIKDMDELTTLELAKIDAIEREAWAAWERSRQPRRKRTSKEKSGSVEVGRTVEGRDGDARFLDKVAWCISERCRILGLYAPEKHALTNPKGTAESAFIRAALEREDTRELLARLSDSLGGLDEPPGPLPESLR